MPAWESDNIYGFDPYIHHYFGSYTVETGAIAPVDGFRDGLPDDRANWPGLHILIGGTHHLTGADIDTIVRIMPLGLGTLSVLAVLLITRRLYGMEAAIPAALLFATADYTVHQSSWLIQGTLGLLIFTMFLLVVAGRVGSGRMALPLVLLLAIASLVSHHFTHLVLMAAMAIAAVTLGTAVERRNLRWALLVMLPLTAAYWLHFGNQTGSFPDIAERAAAALGWTGGLVLAAMIVLAVVVALLRRPEPLRIARAGASLAGRTASRIAGSTPLLVASSVVVTAVTGLLLSLHASNLEDVPGVGLEQVTKYTLVLFGWVGLVTVVDEARPGTRFMVGLFAMLVAGYMAVLLVFTFLPLELRFFEFVYIPLALLSGVGVVRLARPIKAAAEAGRTSAGLPMVERMRMGLPAIATLSVVALLAFAMVSDDQRRMTSDLSERYYHTDAELDAALWIRDNTEPDAVISTPYGVQPVVTALGRRLAESYLVTHSIVDKDYPAAAGDMRVVSHGRPLYVLLTTDTTKYGRDEFVRVDLKEDVNIVGNTFLTNPQFFEYKYSNDEVLIIKVSSNLTG
jgi:hypothetical protein